MPAARVRPDRAARTAPARIATPDPELAFRSCASPWSAPLDRGGPLELRGARHRPRRQRRPDAGVAPLRHDQPRPPETLIVETPANPTTEHSATFTFTGIDDLTPPQFLEYECRLDTRDPDAWLECFNPMIFTNLPIGHAHLRGARHRLAATTST